MLFLLLIIRECEVVCGYVSLCTFEELNKLQCKQLHSVSTCLHQGPNILLTNPGSRIGCASFPKLNQSNVRPRPTFLWKFSVNIHALVFCDHTNKQTESSDDITCVVEVNIFRCLGPSIMTLIIFSCSLHTGLYEWSTVLLFPSL